MNVIDNKPGVVIASVSEVMALEDSYRKEQEELLNEIDNERLQSSLSSHIMSVFQDNKDARQTSGMEEKLLQSLRAYNGRYDPEDLARIKATGGSQIYMNLTPTKCRAAMSWIRDILMPAKETAWSLSPSFDPKLPQEVSDTIRTRIEQMSNELKESGDGSIENATAGVQEMNQLRIDIEEAIADEIYKLAEVEVKKFEKVIADQLEEGEWQEALSDFIEDFCIFQAAILKGPIITKKKKMSWVKGRPEIIEDYCYMNRRVSPLDIYPSASSTKIYDGDLCEHIRLSRKDLYNLIGVEGFSEDYIRELLADGSSNSTDLLDSEIEEEKSIEEYRGDTYTANKSVYHGIHFFGCAPYKLLVDWGIPKSDLGDDEDREFEIEAILVGDRVIKCSINDDPLLRRPYYKACFQNIPGSFWGRSLPELMRDIQRICNATARALSNNMGIASGPQVEVYIDRLAADEELETMYPFKMWQVTTDPTGAGGRAIQFYQPSSNAAELLAVYKEFELRADDATGIPRYAYGGDAGARGAAQTASGLSMLLESASKGIKDAIRHIDDGLIRPRVSYQFYWNMITNPDVEFSGDIQVIAKGSQALTMKGAQEMRRNEFLQILGNQIYSQVVGAEGIAEILREMASSLGLGTNIIPSRIELKRRMKQAEAQQQQQMQAEQQGKDDQTSASIETVKMQVEQAEMASQRNAMLKEKELQQKGEIELGKMQLKMRELEQRLEEVVSKNTAALTKQQIDAAQRDRDTNKNIALSIQTAGQDENNLT